MLNDYEEGILDDDDEPDADEEVVFNISDVEVPKEVNKVCDADDIIVKDNTISVESDKEEEMQSGNDSTQNDDITSTNEDDSTNFEKEIGITTEKEVKSSITEENNTSKTTVEEDEVITSDSIHNEVVEPAHRNTKKIGLIIAIGVVIIVSIAILCLVWR